VHLTELDPLPVVFSSYWREKHKKYDCDNNKIISDMTVHHQTINRFLLVIKIWLPADPAPFFRPHRLRAVSFLLLPPYVKISDIFTHLSVRSRRQNYSPRYIIEHAVSYALMCRLRYFFCTTMAFQVLSRNNIFRY
ncbi:hypothetical protein ACLHY9_24830, partial [Escherichia coli]|uniref:hypothetical protein n=1 Tax=Escherichia coli TaxID=562 RepID=UPI0039A48533